MWSYLRSLYLLLTGAACISVLALNINFQVSQVTVPNTTPLLILSGIILSIVTILALLQQFLGSVGLARMSCVTTVSREQDSSFFLGLFWTAYALATTYTTTTSCGNEGLCHEVRTLKEIAFAISFTISIYSIVLSGVILRLSRSSGLAAILNTRTSDFFFGKAYHALKNAPTLPHVHFIHNGNGIDVEFVLTVPTQVTIPMPVYLDKASSRYYRPHIVYEDLHTMRSIPVEPAPPYMHERQSSFEGGEEGIQIDQEDDSKHRAEHVQV